MKKTLAALLLILPGCASSGPPAPPLEATLTLTEPDFEEKGGILPIIGTLTVTITPEGAGESICKRQILSDVERRGDLSNAERWELHNKVDAWVAKSGEDPGSSGPPYGVLSYGTHKATWNKGASLSPELRELVQYLKMLTLSLNVVRKR
jgi:hypothetical protein